MTEVFYAMRENPTGTREAIHRDGKFIDPMSRAFCPHQWLDSGGYVDLELNQRHPLTKA